MDQPLGDPKAIIVQILTIIEYQGDKVAFAEKMLSLCHFQACAELLERLSRQEQEQIQERLKDQEVTPEKMKAEVMAWFAEVDYDTTLTKVTSRAFADYFKRLVPTLSAQQKMSLRALVGQ